MTTRPYCQWALLMSLVAFDVRAAAGDSGSGLTQPNIVFILADDLGYTDVACFGSKYYETPHIDRLAARGMKFTSGYSCGPNCSPTRAALLSGQYGPRTGIYTVGSIDRFDWQSRPLRPVANVTKLPRDKITIAQALKHAGYATGIVGKWHVGNAQAGYHPLDRGFDEFYGFLGGAHPYFDSEPILRGRQPIQEPEYLTDAFGREAIAFIRRPRASRFSSTWPSMPYIRPCNPGRIGLPTSSPSRRWADTPIPFMPA